MAATEPRATPRETRARARQRIVEAATALVRERSYAKLSVGAIMERAGLGRTIFYRHFDDLGDLLLRAGREAIDELYDAQVSLAATRTDVGPDAVRAAIEVPVAIYRRHGPMLRAVAEAVASDELVAAGQEEVRRSFDALVINALERAQVQTGRRFANLAETARALNLLNEAYLLEAYGHEPRVPTETAVETLSQIWIAVIGRPGAMPEPPA